MKIVQRETDRLTLEGVPQGRGMVFALCVSLGIALVAGLFAVVMQAKTGKWTSAIGPAIGAAFGLFLTAVVVTMMFKRERLTLDRAAGKGIHTTWSLLYGSPKQVSFDFAKVHAVSIQRTYESSGGKRGFPIRVTKARLLLVKPRRAFDLDETQNEESPGLHALAAEVAAFLGVEVKAMGQHDKE